jgi:hypothetical protein
LYAFRLAIAKRIVSDGVAVTAAAAAAALSAAGSAVAALSSSQPTTNATNSVDTHKSGETDDRGSMLERLAALDNYNDALPADVSPLRRSLFAQKRPREAGPSGLDADVSRCASMRDHFYNTSHRNHT